MTAYLLILVAILSRVAPLSHHAWWNFTAVGGSLLFFGARRPLKQAFLPLGLFMAMDYLLTVYAYNYPFHVQDYLITWAWYAAVLVLGQLLLKNHLSAGRVATAVVLSSTSFFLASNYAVWVASTGLYPHTVAGLMSCLAAGLPFYRNDLLSTTLVTGLAFGIPVLARQLAAHEAEAQKRAL